MIWTPYADTLYAITSISLLLLVIWLVLRRS